MSEQLNKSVALQVHRMFVDEVKAAARRVASQTLDPASVVPTIIGAKALDLRIPPMMEQAFGYRGKLRFLEFSFSPATGEFGFSDGGDHVPSNEAQWRMFIRHPMVSSHLAESLYPSLHGSLEPLSSLEDQDGLEDQSDNWHALLLDRWKRQAYACTRKQLTLFFPLTEPDDCDAHTLFLDGMLLSPGCADYKTPAPPELGEQLRAWLDAETSHQAQ